MISCILKFEVKKLSYPFCDSDMRPGVCSVQAYNDTRNPRILVCEDHLRSNLTWKQCCCSIGQGWTVEDEPCKKCPRVRTCKENILSYFINE